jgi:cytochrome c oxidase assembly protein subunit 15
MQDAVVRRFRFVSLLTVIAVYVLILVGGIVRSTGSGMGCPDWPKCFGTWVPPTHLSQLPANYKEVYTAQRVAKNQKLARTLQKLGFKQVAGEIFNHPTQYIETDFNPVKTWIEYINRLTGALIGIFVFLTVIFALPYWRRDATIFWLAFASFILTGVQGWLGSLVVSTNLLPVMVTIHMALALVIVAILLYAVDRARWRRGNIAAADSKLPQATAAPQNYTSLQFGIWLLLTLTFVQILLGTQVREEIDVIAAASGYTVRENWIASLGRVFNWHRTFSAIILLANVYVSYQVWQLAQARLQRLVIATMSLIALEILAGFVLAGFALPAAVQPIHLTLATVIFGTQFLLLLGVGELRKAVQNPRPQGAPQRVVA